MSKTKCPKCHKSFSDDFNRYVLGSATNTLKFAANIGLQAGGLLLGMSFGEHAAHAGAHGGKQLAESIGCDLDKDLNGWKHKCPYCGYQWD